MKSTLALLVIFPLLSSTSRGFDDPNPWMTSEIPSLGGQMLISADRSGYWRVEYELPGNSILFSYDNGSCLLELCGENTVTYIVPSGYSATFTHNSPTVIWGGNGKETAPFQVPSGNRVQKIVVDEASMRAIIGTQTDNATFILQLFDLKNGNSADVDMTALSDTISKNWPHATPSDYVGHWVWQGGIIKPLPTKPGLAIGNPYMAGTLGNFHYTMHVPYFIDLRQPWPKKGEKAILTVGKTKLTSVPDPNPPGKSPR